MHPGNDEMPFFSSNVQILPDIARGILSEAGLRLKLVIP